LTFPLTQFRPISLASASARHRINSRDLVARSLGTNGMQANNIGLCVIKTLSVPRNVLFFLHLPLTPLYYIGAVPDGFGLSERIKQREGRNDELKEPRWQGERRGAE